MFPIDQLWEGVQSYLQPPYFFALLPPILMMLLHYIYIMLTKLCQIFNDWFSKTPHHKTRRRSQIHVPQNPPDGRTDTSPVSTTQEKTLMELSAAITQLRNDLEKLTLQTKGNLADIAKDAKGFTEHVHANLNALIQPISEQLRQLETEQTQLKEDHLHTREVIAGDLEHIMEATSEMEDFITGERFTRPFIHKIHEIV